MSTDLKPCPFCGASAIVKMIGNDYSRKRSVEIKCSVCRVTLTNAAIRHDFDWLMKVSAEAWNMRNSGA